MESRIAAASTIVFTSILGLIFYSGGDSTNSFSSPSPTGSSSNYTIAIVPKNAANPWFVCMETGVNKYAEETGLNTFQKGPTETDATIQAQVIQDLITQGADAVGVVPVDLGTIEPVLKETMDADIVVITHEGASQEDTIYNIETFNDAKYGVFIMDNPAAAMGEKGTYMTMVGHVTNASHNEWANGVVARQKEAYPNMTLLVAEPRVEFQNNGGTAYQVAREVLKKYPGVTGILDTSSFDVPGVARAVGELSLQGKVFTTRIGMPDASKEILDEGLVSALTLWDPADAGYVMASLAVKVLDRGRIEDGVDLGLKGYVIHFAEGSAKVFGGDGWIQITKNSVDSFGS